MKNLELKIKLVVARAPAESGYTSFMRIPDGRVVRLSVKSVSAYRAEFHRYCRPVVKRALASSL